MRDWKKILRLEDDGSKSPLYHLISLNLKKLIQDGVLFPGEMLPSEEEMGEIFRVSRLTIRRAVDDLVREKWLARKQGVGTYVTKPHVTPSIPRTMGFTSKMNALGLTPSSKVLHAAVIPAAEETAAALRVKEGSQVIELVRLRLVNNEPVMLETCYLPYNRFPELMAPGIDNRSLYAFLQEQYSVSVVCIDQVLEPVLIEGEQAQALGVPAGSLGLGSSVIAYAADEQVIEFTRSITRADKCKFMFHFRERAPEV